ncbi:flagellar hook-basal body protein [Burkholderia ubonensis]|nr:flagellar hook-basal body complex protein FliE [Burkholderia ubonensis]KVO87721.1 flagellar hook-basal body protein [Burkholderia ubonensis]KVZ57337.1 flagellar hook-basal body protein [Burkholderia ubonensis]KVZ73035.1 flagellar hook-basal body protein [Burkholderia ubonensis]
MLEAIRNGGPAGSGGVADGAGAGEPGRFADAMERAIEQVDAQQRAASDRLEAVETGDSDDLVGAMLESQQANLSFSMMIQVRNKMMNAFDEIIKMQV